MEMKKESKKGKGRQKIEIKKIDSKINRVVTFSKRKAGLFRKASELGILCGAEIAVLVFSPTGRVFSYGNPSVTYVLDRFLNNQNSAPEAPPGDAPGDGMGEVEALKYEYMELLKQLEAEKIRSSELIKKPSEEEEPPWWEAPIPPDMGLAELQRLNKSMVELRNNVAERVSNFSAPSPFLNELELDPSAATAIIPTSDISYDDDDDDSCSIFLHEYEDFGLGPGFF